MKILDQFWAGFLGGMATICTGLSMAGCDHERMEHAAAEQDAAVAAEHVESLEDWELVEKKRLPWFNGLYRYKVYGGWICIVRTNSCTCCFIPDPNHEWELDK